MARQKLVSLVGLLVLCGGVVLAQVTTGTISGVARDSSGAVLPGARVILLNEDTGISRTVTTDAGGRYSAPGLSLGNYRVTATQPGFQTEVRSGIVLTVGREAVIDLTLTVGAVTQTVEVTGEAPIVESTTATIGSLVDDRTIRTLPLNGRSYDQLALLQPGVTLLNTAPSANGSGPFSGGSGKRISVAGGRPDQNSFLLDGTSINDQANGTPGGASGTNLGVDTIREFRIFTNAFSSEYGHGSGAVISSVTRSGTNSLHGSAFEYIRNSALDARNFFDRDLAHPTVRSSVPSFRRNQFGGTFGGPIKKDKTFFFAGYEGMRQALATTLTAFVPSNPARQGLIAPINPIIVPFLNVYPVPNGTDFGGGLAAYVSAPTVPTNQDSFMGRIDHQLTSKTALFGRYWYDGDSQTAPQNIPPFVQTNSARRQYTTLQANSVLGPNVLNNARFAYNRSFALTDILPVPALDPSLSFIPGQPFGQIGIGSIGGSTNAFTSLGTGSAFPRKFGLNLFEWADDFSYVRGRHSFKTGVLITRIRDNTELDTQLRGNYTFPSINMFLAGLPTNLQAVQVGQNAYRGLRQSMFGVYVLDDFNVTSRLTLNLGLRWEAAMNPTEVNGKVTQLPNIAATALVPQDSFFDTGKKNFEPRVGVAWRLNESGKAVIRAGGGVYHNQLLPWSYAARVGNEPPYFLQLNAPNPTFPNGYTQLTAGPGSLRLNVVDQHLKTPTVYQYNFSIQQQLMKGTLFQVAYIGSKANHNLGQIELNTSVPTTQADGQEFYSNAIRRNPFWNSVHWWSANSNSSYNGVNFVLRRQSTAGLQYQVSYTYSKALDITSQKTGTESGRSPQDIMDPENLKRDWGLADFNAKHNLVMNFSYPVPIRTGSKAAGFLVGGWTLNSIAFFTSGQPITAILSNNQSRNQDPNNSDRPNLKPGASNNPTSGATAGCGSIVPATGLQVIPAGQKLGSPDRWFDPCAFSLPAVGFYGNLGRNTIIGPGVVDVDLSIEKSFKLREQASLNFRAEVFNVLNRANFGVPSASALAAPAPATALVADPSPNAGVITTTTTSARQIQFALRITF